LVKVLKELLEDEEVKGVLDDQFKAVAEAHRY
jgi:hypothetical protein